MKIDELLLQNLPGLAQRPKGVKGEFAQCLKEALAGQAQKQPLEAAGKTGPMEQAMAIAAAGVRHPVDLVESALNRLDAFKEGLARPEQSLKKLAPLVKNLEEDSRRLTELAQKLPQNSPARSLMQETAALSWVEAYKFNRGDYV
ncbi:MAG: hypothetical protein FJ128_09960 [Deltaproteobacteria bacterium]|nr:hypothetical protein [Deltaproteobacteria bacterium]